MALDGELQVKVIGDASQLQTELAGRATQSVERFANSTKSAFDKMGEASQLRTTGMVSDMVKAEQSWLLFDRTFRLGIDREMMTVLNAFPVLTKFLAMLSGSPMLLGAMLGFAFGRRIIDELVKSVKEAYDVVEKLSTSWGDLSERVADSADQLKLQLDHTIEETDRLLHRSSGETELERQLDQVAVNADKTAEALKRDIEEVNKLVNNKDLQSGFMGSFFLGNAPTKPVEKFITNQMKALELIRQAGITNMEEARASGDLKKEEAAQQQTNNSLQAQYNDEINRTKKALAELAHEQEVISHFGPLGQYLFADPETRIVMLSNFLKTLQGQLAQFDTQAKEDAATQHQQILQHQQEEMQQTQQIERAQISAQESIANAKIAAQEESAKNEYRLYQTTLDQETAALINAENDRYEVEMRALDKQIALAKQNPNSAETLPGLQAKAQTATISHHSRLNNITANSTEQQLAQMRSMAQEQINSQEQVAEARINIAKQSYTAEHNQKRISDAEFQSMEAASENQLYGVKFHALADRLNIASQMGEKGKVQYQQILGQIEVLAVQHEAKLDQITETAETQRANEQRTIQTNKLNYALEDSNFQLQQEQRFANERIQYHAESLSKWQAEETQAINQWYAQQQSIYNEMQQQILQYYGQDSVQYADLIRKKELLDREYQQKFIQMQETIAQKHQQTFQTMNNEFQSAFNSWMTNPNRLQHEWVGMMDSMAVSTIDNLAMMLIKHLQYELIRKTTHIATNTEIGASDAASAATTDALNTQSSIKSIAKSAASAAAKAWDALSGIPVVGPVLGAAAAAATFAGVMALAAFDKGGIVPNAPGIGGYGAHVPILAESGERVLTGEQTKNFERLVNNNTTQTGNTVGAIHFSPVFQSGGNSTMDARTSFREFNRQLRLSGLVQ